MRKETLFTHNSDTYMFNLEPCCPKFEIVICLR